MHKLNKERIAVGQAGHLSKRIFPITVTNSPFFFLSFVCFWPTPGSAQGLMLALHSGIIPGRLGGPNGQPPYSRYYTPPSPILKLYFIYLNEAHFFFAAH